MYLINAVVISPHWKLVISIFLLFLTSGGGALGPQLPFSDSRAMWTQREATHMCFLVACVHGCRYSLTSPCFSTFLFFLVFLIPKISDIRNLESEVNSKIGLVISIFGGTHLTITIIIDIHDKRDPRLKVLLKIRWNAAKLIYFQLLLRILCKKTPTTFSA